MILHMTYFPRINVDVMSTSQVSIIKSAAYHMPQLHHIFQRDWQEVIAGIKVEVMLEKSTAAHSRSLLATSRF